MEKFVKTFDIMQLILDINKVLYITTTDEISHQKKTIWKIQALSINVN